MDSPVLTAFFNIFLTECSAHILRKQFIRTLYRVDMRSLVAVACADTGADGCVAYIKACGKSGIGVGTVAGSEDIEHVICARSLRGIFQLMRHIEVVREARIFAEDRNLPFIAGLLGSNAGEVDSQEISDVSGDHRSAVTDLLVEGDVNVDLAGKCELPVPDIL